MPYGRELVANSNKDVMSQLLKGQESHHISILPSNCHSLCWNIRGHSHKYQKS